MSARARVSAPAKVNLVLRVLQRRADGYHEISTLFQAIDLSDEVEVELTGGGIRLEVEGAAHLGPVEENLAYRAAERLLAEVAPGRGARVLLRKRIPVGAGLGGGSSDAAAVLRCLAEIVDVTEKAVLHGIGAELGSDVPFFLGESPLAHGRGRGEILDPLPPLTATDLLILSPHVHVSTAGAYAALAEVRAGASSSDGSTAMRTPSTWHELKGWAHNDFQQVISAAHPEVRRALRALEGSGAAVALMSGSGSSCFGLYEDSASAHEAARELGKSPEWTCSMTRTLTALPSVQVEQ